MRLIRIALRVLLGLSLLILGSSFFYPKVKRVQVSGAAHYSEADILRLARVRVGFPLLWVTTQRVGALKRDPWILSLHVVRKWPHTLYLSVTERTPVLARGTTAYALDGTVLPGATPADRAKAVPLRGWGPDRSAEALEIFQLVASKRPQMLSYAPSGFTVSFAGSSLYTPEATLLRAHWAAFVEQRAERVAVYPWGVSTQVSTTP